MIDPSILLDSKPVSIETPLQAQSQALGVATQKQNLTNLGTQDQLNQAALTGAQQENQIRAQQIQDQQTMRQAFLDSNGDPNRMLALARQRGVMPQTLMQLQGSLLDMQTKYATLDKDTLANQQSRNDQLQSLLAPVASQSDPQKQQAAWNDSIGQAISKGLMQPQEAAQHPYPGPEGVKSYAASLNLEKWALAQQQLGTANQRNASADKDYQQMISNAYAGVKNADDLNAANVQLMSKLPPKYANQLLTKYDPDQVAAVVNPSVTPTQRADMQLKAAELAKLQQDLTGTQPLSPYQQGELKLRGQEVGIARQRETREASQSQQVADPLANLSGAQLQVIKSMANGDVPLPSNRSKEYQPTLAAVQAYDPTFTEARYKGKQAFKTGGDANNIVSITTALAHLDSAEQNSAALGTSPTQALNVTPAQRRYHADADMLQGEIGKLIKAGVVTEGESNRLLSNLNSWSQSNRDAALDELKNLMGGKFEGIRQKYRNATGQELPVSMFDPLTQQRLVQQKLIAPPNAAAAPNSSSSAAGAGTPTTPQASASSPVLPKGNGTALTNPVIAKQFLDAAGGDKNQARVLAQQSGWKF